MNYADKYLRWITPSVGDPTYSLLKAHLLFEELMNAYLSRVLPHASALQGARFTFAQKLSLARASSTHLEPDHWIWKAIGELNRIRNSLSHEISPKDLAARIDAYVELVIAQSGSKLPTPGYKPEPQGEGTAASPPLYTAADIATVNLYFTTGALLGFKIPSNSELS